MNPRKKVQTRKARIAEKEKETSTKLPEHNKASPKIQGTYKKEKYYACEKCNLKLENKKNLRDHDCNTQKKTECKCCGYEFLSELHLKHHKELITKDALNQGLFWPCFEAGNLPLESFV